MTGGIKRFVFAGRIRRLEQDLEAARIRYRQARDRGDTRGQKTAQEAAQRARTELMRMGA